MLEAIFDEMGEKMDKALQTTERELKALRTGRATTNVVEGVIVKAYGTDTPLNQVASVSTPDASTIVIQPWDANVLGDVEKALMAANLGLTPNNDGKVIRINVPTLTEETRKDIVKKSHEIAENGRIAVRNMRRHANDEIKKTEKKHEISEDDMRRFRDRVQKVTDKHIETIDNLLAHKETEIMQV